MNRRDRSKPPRPGMKWSEEHRLWVDADTRTLERRRKDEAILEDIEADRERIDQLLQSAREAGGPPEVAEASALLARKLLRSLIAARTTAGLSQAEVAKRLHISQMHVSRLEHRALERVRQIGRQG